MSRPFKSHQVTESVGLAANSRLTDLMFVVSGVDKLNILPINC